LDAEILLCETVRGAAQARGRQTRIVSKTLTMPVFPPLPPPERQRVAPAARPVVQSIIALGASTGGTEALRLILERLPPDAPPVVVVQHMPELFTAAFARRLDECCQVTVKEAAQGDDLVPGRVLVAPGNRHLVVRRQGRQYFVEL